MEVSADERVVDGRLLRGTRSRQAVVRRAIDIASLNGLDGLSFGRLADDLGISKAGIQTLFRSKEKLQLATIEAAARIFVDAVIRPAATAPQGAARIRALLVNWLEYASRPLLPGGCFWSATLPEYDSRPGPVRDALAAQQAAWRALLADQFRYAAEHGETAEIDPVLAAFQLTAVLNAANLILRLGDPSGVSMAERTLDGLLRPTGTQITSKTR